MTATNFEINSDNSGTAASGNADMANYNSPDDIGGSARILPGNSSRSGSQDSDLSVTIATSSAGSAALLLPPNSPSSSSSTSKNNGDATFEPTVDMMVNDFDDEQTLEEEEALAAREAEDPSAELSNLQKESDMPIEELLALYNCAGPAMLGSTFTTTVPIAATSASSSNKRGSSTSHRLAAGGNSVLQSGGGGGGGGIAASKLRRAASTSASRDGGGGGGDSGGGGASSSRENGITTDELIDDDFVNDDDDDDEIKETSKLRKLYPETYGGNEKRLLRTISREPSEEDDDGDYSPDDDEFKKTIMVGSEFQAVIPEGFFKYDDVLPYENEDKLLWDPSCISGIATEEYLLNILQAKRQHQQNGSSSSSSTGGGDGVASQSPIGITDISTGNHLRDDEQALHLLLQCGHNTEEALRRKRINTIPSSEQMSSWSEDECRNFESGIRIYGKDFHTIQKTKVRTRSVGELVQFYYLWKKTERHDFFANKARLEKKKYSLHPGLTDYMDRFLEEQDGNGNTTGSMTCQATANSYGSNMTLRDRSLSPGLHYNTTQHTRKHNQLSSIVHSSPSQSGGGGASSTTIQTRLDCSTMINTKDDNEDLDNDENDAEDDEEDSDNLRDRINSKNLQTIDSCGGSITANNANPDSSGNSVSS